MNKFLIVFCLCSCALNLVTAAKFPGYLVKCKKGSPDFNKCLSENYVAAIKQLATNGEPKFKLPNLATFKIPKLELQASKELQISLVDSQFVGIDKNELRSLTIDDNELKLEFYLKELQFTGNYQMDGRILILPIKGAGTMNVMFNDFTVSYVGKLQKQTIKGKEYYQLSDDTSLSSLKLEPKKVHFEFNNLFGGDPKLGSEMNKFLNENWQEVYNEVRASLQEAATIAIFNMYINGYLRNISVDELFAV